MAVIDSASVLASGSPCLPTMTANPPHTSSVTSPSALLDSLDQQKPLDPVALLNQHYASEALLAAQLPLLRQGVTSRMTQLNDQIAQALQTQTDADTAQHVQLAQTSIAELASRVQVVQTKAQQSATTVRAITKDLQRLDTAQRNLQAAITMLKRLHMLVQAVEQLRVCNDDYATAAQLFQAIAAFDRMEPLRPIHETVDRMQEEWKGKVRESIVSDEAETVRGCLAVSDALGLRDESLKRLADHWLKDYQDYEPPVKQEKRVSSFKVVAEEKPSHALELVEQRFLWFRQVLERLDEQFPDDAHWNFAAYLAREFLVRTQQHLKWLLEPGNRRDADADNATILLKALQKTIVFEKEITVWLKKEHGVVFREEEGGEGLEPLIGIASTAFDNYMGPYIAVEEQTMDEQLVSALEDGTVDSRGERPVFISSTNLFVYIKGSITRCTALNKGKAFFLLFQAFQDSLRKYSQILNGKLPSPMPAGGGIPFGPKNESSQQQYRIANGGEVTIAHVVATCEYVAETVESLEELICDTIDEEFKKKIVLDETAELFHDVTAKCIRILVSGLNNRTEPAMKMLASTDWVAMETVGDDSMYVRSVHSAIEPFVASVGKLLPKSYFRSFCDKFALAFSTTYFDTIARLKRINEAGTQQLLLDVYNLKTLFLKLPVMEEAMSPGRRNAGASTIAPAMYTKMVNEKFGRIETMLKLIGTPTEMLVDNFKVQWPAGSALDLQIVMSLKGLKRNEQSQLLEKFGVDHASAVRYVTAGITAAAVSERVVALQEQGSTVAAKVSTDLNQMRQKVDDLRKAFR